jgi:hypothetical protein
MGNGPLTELGRQSRGEDGRPCCHALWGRGLFFFRNGAEGWPLEDRLAPPGSFDLSQLSRRDRIERAKGQWKAGSIRLCPTRHAEALIPLPETSPVVRDK